MTKGLPLEIGILYYPASYDDTHKSIQFGTRLAELLADFDIPYFTVHNTLSDEDGLVSTSPDDYEPDGYGGVSPGDYIGPKDY